MKYRSSFASLVLFALVLSGCMSTPSGMQDITGTFIMRDDTIREGHDVQQGGRTYKGLYSNIQMGKTRCNYKILANRKNPQRSDIHMKQGDRMKLTTGLDTVWYDDGTKYQQVCQGGLCHNKHNNIKQVEYLAPQLKVTMNVHSYSKNKQWATMTNTYSYRDYGPFKRGDAICIDLVMDKTIGFPKGNILMSYNRDTWYEIIVAYHDPKNRAGSQLKSWHYTVNKW